MPNFVAENIKFLRLKKSVSQDTLALQVKKGYTTISNWEKKVSTPTLDEIDTISNYFEVNAQDLIFRDLSKGNLISKGRVSKIDEKSNLKGNRIGNLNTEKAGNYAESEPTEKWVMQDAGKGDKRGVVMPRVVTMDTTGEENAVFVPVKARAGYLLGFGDTEFIGKLPVYKIIGDRHKTYRIFEIDGNSMFPTLNDKDTVNAYWVRVSEIRNERLHVLLTRNDGILIKRVINRYEDGILVCKSDNINKKNEYPPIVLNIHDVVEAWYVDSRTSHNLTPPGEIYERISNLEANLAIVMHNAGLLK